MTVDNNVKTNLELLDKILNCLISDSTNYTLTVDSLYKFVFNSDVPQLGRDGFISYVIHRGNNFNFNDFNMSSDSLSAEYLKFQFACQYLYSEGLVEIDKSQNVAITYKGIIQISKSFLKQYKRENHKTNLDIYSVYISIGLSMVGLIVGYFLSK